MSRNFNFAPGEFYHIYNRGVEKRKIFLKNSDYDRMMFLLYICNNTESVHIQNYRGLTLIEKFSLARKNTLVEIGAVCLMPNHFHLLVKEKIEGGISIFMQKLTTAYTMYFNTLNDRSGSLFQGTFKSRHIDREEYLNYLYAYIHLNPIKIIEPDWKENSIKNKSEAKNFLDSYKFSSYMDYCGLTRPENSILNREVFPEHFQNKSSFNDFIKDWLNFDNFIEV